MTPLILLSLIACTSQSDDSGKGSRDDSGTAVDPGGDDEIVNLSFTTVEDMSAVFVVEWETTAPGTSWVEFGPDESYGLSTVLSDSTSTQHRVVVMGAPFGANWHWRAASLIDGTTYYSADQLHRAGQKPAGLIGFDVETVVPSGLDHGIRIIPYFTSVNAGVMVLNRDGDLAWYREFDSPESTTQAIMSPDGTGIIVMIGDVTRHDDIGEIRYISWDLETTWQIRAEWAHHDFQRMPDGSWAFLAADIREADNEMVAGDAVMRMDADGGNLRAIWSTWDAFEVPSFRGCRPSYYPDYCDWTHANGLYYDEATDTFGVSIHNDDAVAVISGDGDPLYSFGNSDWATISPGSDATFYHQHGVKRLDGNQWAVFDNGQMAPQGHSRALVVEVDPEASRFETSWEYEWDSTYSSSVLGDHDVLANGNHLLSWGSEAVVSEVTPDKEIVFEVTFDLGASVGFVSFEGASGGVLE